MPHSTTFKEVADAAGLPSKVFYTLTEVSEILGIPRSTIDLEARKHRLTSFLPEGRKQGRLIKPEWVDEWIEAGIR